MRVAGLLGVGALLAVGLAFVTYVVLGLATRSPNQSAGHGTTGTVPSVSTCTAKDLHVSAMATGVQAGMNYVRVAYGLENVGSLACALDGGPVVYVRRGRIFQAIPTQVVGTATRVVIASGASASFAIYLGDGALCTQANTWFAGVGSGVIGTPVHSPLHFCGRLPVSPILKGFGAAALP